MARSAYKAATRWQGIVFAGALAGVLALHATVFFMIHTQLDRKIGAWVAVIGLAPLVVVVGASWILVARLNRRRVHALALRLREHGFAAVEKPGEAERAAFAAPVAHLFPSLDLRNGPAGIRWFSVQRDGAAKALLFEHEYVTGSGKTTQEHHHTVLAWPAGHPDLRDTGLATSPWFFMAQYPRFIRRGVRARELTLPEFAELGAVWSLLGDAATATRFLTPEVRRALRLAPKKEAWAIGAGWVCCSFEGSVDVPNLDRFLSHARGVLASVGR